MNLQAVNNPTTNVGNYEFLRVSSVVGNVVTFDLAKTKFYGSGASDDTDLWTNQYVTLQRVPNYENLTINGTLSTNGFTGPILTGVIAFRVKGVLSGSGLISAQARGYAGGGNQGGSYRRVWVSPIYKNNVGGGGSDVDSSGGGGGYGTAGDSGNDIAWGGSAYGTADLSRLFHGSGGGKGASGGGQGGGIVFIQAYNIDFGEGNIYAHGATGAGGGATQGGGGAGGSILIVGNSVTLDVLTAAAGGTGMHSNGGVDRIAIYSPLTVTYTPRTRPRILLTRC